MAEYAMTLKESKNSNGLVFKTKANSLEEATEFFRKLKQMPKENFNEIFLVSTAKRKKQ